MRLLMVGGIAAVLGSCGFTPSPSPLVESRPSAPTSDELLAARRFREDFGLRSDDGWVREVATNPQAQAAIRVFGVPLLPAELQLLQSRADAFPEIEQVIDEYGQEHSDEYGGAFVDNRQGVVVAQFTGNTDIHRRELAKRLQPNAPIRVREAEATLLELQRLADRIDGESAWFQTIDANKRGVGILVDQKKVEVRVSTTNPDAKSAILAHFEAPDLLVIKDHQVKPWTGGMGSLLIRAVDSSGRPVPGLDCEIEPDDVSAYSTGDTAWLTDQAGTCLIPDVGATGYVRLIDRFSGSGTVVGTNRVDVTDGGTVSVTVTVH